MGDVQYGACLSAVRRLLRCAKMHCGRIALLYFCFRCCCAMRSVGARLENILFYRIEKGFLLFCSAQHPCSAPALRAEQAQGVSHSRRAAKPPTAAQSIRPAQRFLPLAKMLSRRRRRGRRGPYKTRPGMMPGRWCVWCQFCSALHACGNNGHLVDRPEKRGFSGAPI